MAPSSRRPHLALLALVSLHLQLAQCSTAWTPATYPNPTRDLDACGRRGKFSWVCDPDGVLSFSGADVVEGITKAIATGEAPYARADCGAAGQQGFQVAVALMDHFKLDPLGDAAATARHFAKALHDSWGVGRSECGNGVVLLLSIRDRQVYISTGSGARELLTDQVVEHVLANMKQDLRSGSYDEAVAGAAIDMGRALAGKDIGQKSGDGLFLFFFFVLLIVGLFIWSLWHNRGQRNRLRDCKSKLEQLKRDQVAVRDRRYVASSCPVCLDQFEPAEPVAFAASSSVAPSAPPLPTYGVDDVAGPSAPLLGGGVSGGVEGGVEDVAGGSTVGGHSGWGKGAKSKPPQAAAAAAAPPAKKPLVLPCGHGFCESCISEWLKSKSSCPICRKDITDDPAAQAATRGPQSCQDASGLTEQQRLLQEEEIMFRLARVQYYYPDVVTQGMMNSWRHDVSEGRALSLAAIDRLSLQTSAVQAHYRSAGSSGASFSFGGGGSRGGGGGGGSW